VLPAALFIVFSNSCPSEFVWKMHMYPHGNDARADSSCSELLLEGVYQVKL
jgi:hypothetical protein